MPTPIFSGVRNQLDCAGNGEMQNMSEWVAPMTDDDLVLEAQAGDTEAFAELMKRHSPASLKLAVSILRDPVDAEDEVQNAYWKAWRHIGQFEREARFSTWITRIVMNQCLMRLRQKRRAQFLSIDDAAPGGERSVPELADCKPSPEEDLSRSQLAGVLHREIRRIPPLLRHALVLREVNELPMAEVAGRLGISVAAAKSRLLRARAELRSRMERHFPLPAAAA
jgi:RNA polymerase sigma-70 factor, ECF subfamily